MKIIDGLLVSQIIRDEIKEEVDKIIGEGLRKPCLVAIIVGDNIASKTYVKSKIKNSELVGFYSYSLELKEDISEEILIEEIEKLNNDDKVDGFIVQLPLPKHIDERKINNLISPDKDIDGFHPINIGRMVLGYDDVIIPATPYGILELLRYYQIETKGRNVVVLGRSNIVGKPISILLGRNDKIGNATVTICNSNTIDIEKYTLNADIIISAIGKNNFLKADMVKSGVVVIDVGINRQDDKTKKNGYRIVGDVDFENIKEKASFITPVPGGVGPMTIAMLLKNTLTAYKKNVNRYTHT